MNNFVITFYILLYIQILIREKSIYNKLKDKIIINYNNGSSKY